MSQKIRTFSLLVTDFKCSPRHRCPPPPLSDIYILREQASYTSYKVHCDHISDQEYSPPPFTEAHTHPPLPAPRASEKSKEIAKK